MTTVICDREHCLNRGKEVCTASRIHMALNGKCEDYVTSRDMQPLSVRCHKTQQGYKSDRTGMVLK